FDRLQKLSDPDPEACPACGGAQVRREVTAPAFRLAGTGWYETDFKKDGDRKRNLADAGDGGGKSEGGSAASKPEAKADTPARSADAASSAAPATAGGPSGAPGRDARRGLSRANPSRCAPSPGSTAPCIRPSPARRGSPGR